MALHAEDACRPPGLKYLGKLLQGMNAKQFKA